MDVTTIKVTVAREWVRGVPCRFGYVARCADPAINGMCLAFADNEWQANVARSIAEINERRAALNLPLLVQA
jgi:hypothetical protein